MEKAHEMTDAAKRGDAAKVKELLAEDRNLVNACSPDGWTALHLAAHFGHIEVAKLLLDKGADVNDRSQNSLHNLPIHAAVAGRRKEMVELLVARGSDVNAKQHGGWTPLHGAAISGEVETVKLLIANNADIHARADGGQTALSLALEKGHGEVAELVKG